MVNFDDQALQWDRDDPRTIDDFMAKTVVLDLFSQSGRDKEVLDIGCGEGYVARQMARLARKVIGIDCSEGMIRIAREKERREPQGITYHVGDARNINFIPSSSQDIAVANFVTNYFKPQELSHFYMEMARYLKPVGQFIVSTVHPSFFLTRQYGKAMHFQIEDYDYLASRGKIFKGTLTTITGQTLCPEVCHSTLGDHFQGLSAARLAVTGFIEPTIDPAIVSRYPLFKEFEGRVLFMVITGHKY